MISQTPAVKHAGKILKSVETMTRRCCLQQARPC